MAIHPRYAPPLTMQRPFVFCLPRQRGSLPTCWTVTVTIFELTLTRRLPHHGDVAEVAFLPPSLRSVSNHTDRGCSDQNRLGFVNGAMDTGFYWITFSAGLARVGYSLFCGVLIYQLWAIRKSTIDFPPLVIAAVPFAILAAHPSSNLQAVYDLRATIVSFPLIVWLAASSQARPLAHTFLAEQSPRRTPAANLGCHARATTARRLNHSRASHTCNEIKLIPKGCQRIAYPTPDAYY